jgi:hypothetical protein
MPFRCLSSILAGLVIACLALVLAHFVTNPPYFSIDLTKVPPEAAAIVNESRGKVETKEEWDDKMRRFQKALDKGGYEDPLTSKYITSSWYWFFFLPPAWLLLRLWRWRTRILVADICVVFPSYLILGIAVINVFSS